MRTCPQRCQQTAALIKFVIPETHHQIGGLVIVALDQSQRFLWTGAEFRFQAKPGFYGAEQGNGLIGGEIVEAQRHHGLAAPAAIRGEQVQFAAQAVTKPKRWIQASAKPVQQLPPTFSQAVPGLSGLKLMIEPRHIAPGMDGQIA